MIYGYARISTKNQSIDRQIRNILKHDNKATVVEEIYTGTTSRRSKWDALKRKLRPGDTLIFDSVSRMSRDAEQGIEDYRELFDRGVRLIFLKERFIDSSVFEDRIRQSKEFSIDTEGSSVLSAVENFIKEIIVAMIDDLVRKAFEQAEKEVEDLRQRTREGMETARAKGKQIGTVKGSKLTTKKSLVMKERIRKMAKTFEGNMKDKEVIEALGIARNTYFKYKRELRIETL